MATTQAALVTAGADNSVTSKPLIEFRNEFKFSGRIVPIGPLL